MADYYGICDAFHAKLNAVMSTIRIAFDKGWHRLWLESDSSLVVEAFTSPEIVPWNIRIKWRNCLHIADSMELKVSHIFREGNFCVDRLASYGVSSKCYSWWDLVPRFIRADFFHNKWGLPMYRFK